MEFFNKKSLLFMLLLIGLPMLSFAASREAMMTPVLQKDKPTIYTPNDIKYFKALVGGVEAFYFVGSPIQESYLMERLRYPKKFRFTPPHSHKGMETFTVISGTFNFGVGNTFDKTKTKKFTAGSIIIIPPGVVHYVWSDDSMGETTIVQLTTGSGCEILPIFYNKADNALFGTYAAKILELIKNCK